MTNPDALAPEMLQYIRQWLRTRGLKQHEAARHLGVSEPTFSNWLRGRQPMKSEYFQRLAGWLKISPAQLMHAPRDAESAKKYDRALAVLDHLDADQVEDWLRMGEAVLKASGKKVLSD